MLPRNGKFDFCVYKVLRCMRPLKTDLLHVPVKTAHRLTISGTFNPLFTMLGNTSSMHESFGILS